MADVIRAAAERARFGATDKGIVWAVVDSGIDDEAGVKLRSDRPLADFLRKGCLLQNDGLQPR